MPVVPTADPALLGPSTRLRLRRLQQVSAFWKKILAQGMTVSLPERKPVDTFYANLVYDLIARDHIARTTSRRSTSSITTPSICATGQTSSTATTSPATRRLLGRTWTSSPNRRRRTGTFSPRSSSTTAGRGRLGYSQHYRITHDKAFAEWALPQIARAVDWLRQARAADPLHIMPASDVRDNEFVPDT